MINLNQKRIAFPALALFLIGIYFLYKQNDLRIENHLPFASTNLSKPSLLFAFIAVGDNINRSNILKHNLQIFKKKSLKYNVDCIIFSYAKYNQQAEWLHAIEKDPSHICQVVRHRNSEFIDFLKSLIPKTLSHYAYITIALDDVKIDNVNTFNIDTYFTLIEKLKLSVSTIAVSGTNYPHLHPVSNYAPHQRARQVAFIEFQFSTYRSDAWACMYELADTEFQGGWGLDTWFLGYCVLNQRVKGRMAVVDEFTATHNPDREGTLNRPGVDLWAVTIEQEKEWLERGITLVKHSPTTSIPIFDDEVVVVGLGNSSNVTDIEREEEKLLFE